MSEIVYSEAQPVAFLTFCSIRPGSSRKRHNIFAREEFDVGRGNVERMLQVQAPTISNHHLRFRCIVYEEDDEETGIAPMIYFRVLSSNNVKLKSSITGLNTSVVISRGHGDILLGQDDEIQLTPEISLHFRYHKHIIQMELLDGSQVAEAKCFADRFLLTGRRLGVGGQASVYIAIHRKTQRQLACKAVPLPKARNHSTERNDEGTVDLRPRNDAKSDAKLLKARKALAREYAILEQLNHPNIVSLQKVICATHNVYIFQELITGGDLSSYIDLNGRLPESEAAAITFQLLTAIEYLHSNGFAHRDIKPENVLMTSWKEGARVVLTDFGQARAIDSPKFSQTSANVLRMQSIVGTYGYVAPEICQQMKDSLDQGGYSKAVDIWSVGCVTALLLTGHPLFTQDANDYAATAEHAPSESVCRKRWNVDIIDQDLGWTKISRRAKGFVKGALQKQESQRLTAKAALAHEWFTNKNYAFELAELSKRAVADWRPAQQQSSLIEFIDTAKPTSGRAKGLKRAPSPAARTSKHFQPAQKAPVLGLSRMKKSARGPAHPVRPAVAGQSVMSRDTRENNGALPASYLHETAASMLTTQPYPDGFMLGSTWASHQSTDPLSIWRYAPPQTQYQTQQTALFRCYNGSAPPQASLSGSKQSRLIGVRRSTNAIEQVVDSQETQTPSAGGANRRPTKKVCR